MADLSLTADEQELLTDYREALANEQVVLRSLLMCWPTLPLIRGIRRPCPSWAARSSGPYGRCDTCNRPPAERRGRDCPRGTSGCVRSQIVNHCSRLWNPAGG